MIYLVAASLLLGFIGHKALRDKSNEFYSVGGYAAFAFAGFLMLMAIQMSIVQTGTVKLFNGGLGTEYLQPFNNTTISHVYYDRNDIRVGTFLAYQDFEWQALEIFSSIMPGLGILLAGWAIWHYMGTWAYSRGDNRQKAKQEANK